MQSLPNRSVLACVAAAAVLCVLGFYSLLSAAPAGGKPPFEDAVTQREEMIRELREIKELIREQNGLLKESLAKPHDRIQIKK
jgi:hypothetical protein